MPLGKSLDNILGSYFGEEEFTLDMAKKAKMIVQEIDVDKITISPYQTRQKFEPEKIQALAKDIETNGLISPILVIQKKPGQKSEKEYILLAGERRLRAVKLLKLPKVFCIVKAVDSLNEQQQAMLSAMENLQREDLSAIELAETYQMLLKTQDFEYKELAKTLGHSEQYVKNYIKLLELCEEVKQALLDKKIGEGQARFLVGLEVVDQQQILQQILDKKLTVKEIAALVKSFKDEEILDEKESKKVRESRIFRHAQAHQILPKVEKLSQMFENSIFKCQGDENEGRIVIVWKKQDGKVI